MGMSGLLRKGIVFILFFCWIIWLIYNRMFIIAIIALCCLLCYGINHLIKRKVLMQVPNQIIYKERNFDYLIIGDICNVENTLPQGSRFLKFTSCNRTLFASFLILKRMYSYLKKGGIVILVLKDNNIDENKVSLYEYPFLHPVTIKQYHLEYIFKEMSYPLVYCFFSIFHKRRRKSVKNKILHEKSCPNVEIIHFCKNRGIGLLFFQYK